MRTGNYGLYNLTLIDGTGQEPQLNKGIIVKDGKIQAILSSDQVKEAGGIEKYDMEGMCLLPGLIDAHVHLSGVIGDRVGAFNINHTVRAYKSLIQAQAMMSYGITSVRDISPLGLYLKRMIARGEVTGPRIVACGPGLTRSGGHADIPELPFSMVDNPHDWTSNHYWGVFADGEVEIRKLIRLQLREGADQIKFWVSGGGYSSVDRNEDMHYTYEECRIIVEEAKLINHMKVLSHAENLESIRWSIDAGVDSIEHGDELDEEQAERMAEKGIYLVPTINLVGNWYLDRFGDKKVEATPASIEYGPFRHIDLMSETAIDPYKNRDTIYGMFKMAKEKGVKIAMGSDTVRDRTTKYGEYSIREMLAMEEAGMTALEVITAATKTAAEVLGLDRYIGTIEEGKWGDFIVVNGNPAKDLKLFMNKENVRYIFQNGQLKVKDGQMLGFGGIL